MFPRGVDYIIAMTRPLRVLGISVSSLYGAPPVRRVPTVFAYPCGLSIHRYPKIFIIAPFPMRAALLTGRRSTIELSRNYNTNTIVADGGGFSIAVI